MLEFTACTEPIMHAPIIGKVRMHVHIHLECVYYIHMDVTGMI